MRTLRRESTTAAQLTFAVPLRRPPACRLRGWKAFTLRPKSEVQTSSRQGQKSRHQVAELSARLADLSRAEADAFAVAILGLADRRHSEGGRRVDPFRSHPDAEPVRPLARARRQSGGFNHPIPENLEDGPVSPH